MTNRSTVPRRFQPRINGRCPDPCPALEGDCPGDFSGPDLFMRGDDIDPDPGCDLGQRDERGCIGKVALRPVW